MKNNTVGGIVILCVVFVALKGIFSFVHSVTTTPVEGDSLAYHIPIAHSIISGAILNPALISSYGADNVLHYYPSFAEGILSIFILSSIPLNLFNVCAWLMLFGACYILGRRSDLDSWISIIFASSVVMLYGVIRWLDAQIIDIWLGVFFVGLLALLTKKIHRDLHFLMLGLLSGMLTGTKYSGIFFTIFIFAVYYRSYIHTITPKRIMLFCIPFVVLGLSWYIRNILLTGNPFYPQGILFLKGAEDWNILRYQVWEMIFSYPWQMANAFISEYVLWSAALLSVPFFLVYTRKKRKDISDMYRLLVLSAVNGFFYLFLVSTPEYNIMVSSFRYSYPVFIPLMLVLFLIAKKLQHLELIGYFALVNFFAVSTYSYHPKIFLIMLPVLFAVYYLYCRITRYE